MMKHYKNRFILSNGVLHFFDPLTINFQRFISLIWSNKIRNEKTDTLCQSYKNQHLEKMLVFFCIKNKMVVRSQTFDFINSVSPSRIIKNFTKIPPAININIYEKGFNINYGLHKR